QHPAVQRRQPLVGHQHLLAGRDPGGPDPGGLSALERAGPWLGQPGRPSPADRLRRARIMAPTTQALNSVPSSPLVTIWLTSPKSLSPNRAPIWSSRRREFGKRPAT